MTHQRIITPGMGEKVIQTLSRYASLPSSGIIAGQAVASALDEILGTGKPVYNDIDVFLSDDQWMKAWPADNPLASNECFLDSQFESLPEEKPKTLVAGRVTYFDDPSYSSDDYACKLSVAQRELYSIGQTRTQDMLNYVRMDWSGHAIEQLRTLPDELQTKQQMTWLTKVFDMNCTQAAVDLATGEIHVSGHYSTFLRSRQLQVVTGYTPVHSILRFLKKKEELKVFGNEEMHLRMLHRLVQNAQGDSALTAVRRRNVRAGMAMVTWKEVEEECKRQKMERGAYLSELRAGQGDHCRPLSFGRKYYEQYVKYQKLLNPYFILTRHPNKDVWLLTSKTVDTKVDHYTEYQSSSVVALNFAEGYLAPSKVDKAREEGFQLLLSALSEHSRNTMQRARNNQGRAYCEGMEDENLRRRWLAVAPKHPEFFWCTVALPFRTQIDFLRKMRATFKKLGIESPWGALAYKSSNFVRCVMTNDNAWKQFVDSHLGTYEPLCQKLPLPDKVGDVVVRELATSRDLQDEGRRMRHCVGGYSSAVSEGMSRIISLSLGESSADCSTVEWGIVYSFDEAAQEGMARPKSARFEMRQNYGPGNTSPRNELLSAEMVLRSQLNSWLETNWDDAVKTLNAESLPVPNSRLKAILAAQLADDIPF